jgi:hypothetical protein
VVEKNGWWRECYPTQLINYILPKFPFLAREFVWYTSSQRWYSMLRQRPRTFQKSFVRSFFKDTFYVSTAANPATGAINPAIEFSTTYERDENGNLRDGFYYSRIRNPTRREFEKIVTRLEEGVESFAFSSGMQAATSILLSSPGSYVLLPDDLYHGVWFTSLCLPLSFFGLCLISSLGLHDR